MAMTNFRAEDMPGKRKATSEAPKKTSEEKPAEKTAAPKKTAPKKAPASKSETPKNEDKAPAKSTTPVTEENNSNE